MSRILNAKRAKNPYRNDLDCVAQVVGARVKVDPCADPLTGFFYNVCAAALGTQVATLMPSRFFGGRAPEPEPARPRTAIIGVLMLVQSLWGGWSCRVGHLDHCRPKRLAHFWIHKNSVGFLWFHFPCTLD